MEVAKKGMCRYDTENCHRQPKEPIVPEIGGKAKSGKERARPIVADAPCDDGVKVWHAKD